MNWSNSESPGHGAKGRLKCNMDVSGAARYLDMASSKRSMKSEP